MDIDEMRAIIQNSKRPGGATAQEEDSAVAAVIQQVIQITEKHFAQAGRALQMERTPTSSWFSFGVRLRSALIPHTDVLHDADTLAFLRSLCAEIFDFLMFVYDSGPAREMAELDRTFGSGIRCGPILPLLLPDRAQSVMAEMNRILDADHEEEMRRQDQMGY